MAMATAAGPLAPCRRAWASRLQMHHRLLVLLLSTTFCSGKGEETGHLGSFWPQISSIWADDPTALVPKVGGTMEPPFKGPGPASPVPLRGDSAGSAAGVILKFFR